MKQLGFALAVGSMPWRCSAGTKSERLNIVMLIADDFGYADMSFLPSAAADIHTPNLDRLAGSGVYFTNAYVTSPICSASRAGILTGRYQQRWGNYSLGQSGHGVPNTEQTIPQALKSLDYVTKKVGKNHVGGRNAAIPWKIGFDEFLGFFGSTKDYLRLSVRERDALGPEGRHYIVAAGPLIEYKNGKESRRSFEKAYSTDVFTDAAVEFIQRDHGDNPFYLHVSFNATHHPQYQVKRELLEETGLTQLMWTPESGMTPDQWHSKHGWLGEIDPDGRKRYLACTRVMDEGIGRILDALDQAGIADNTLVVFVSDNGGSQNTYSCNGPLHGHKYTLTEGGIRVPLIMSCPGRLPAGHVHDEPVISLDIFPTLVDAAGGRVKTECDGRSLLPLFQGRPAKPLHRFLCWDQGAKGKEDWAIRVGNWKLRVAPQYGVTRTYCGDNDYGRGTKTVHGLVFYDYPSPSGTLLYNLKDDIGEKENLAEKMPEKVEELRAMYAKWRAQMQDPFKLAR
jgi:arylsulfatase A-like enzyme